MVISMKKTIIATLFVLALTLSVPFSVTQGISVGETFNFDIRNASGNFDYSTGSGTVEGETDYFRVGDTAVNEDQQITCEVTSVGSSSVNYDLSVNGTVIKSATSSALGFGLGLILYSVYPFLVMGISTGSVNPIDVSKGVSLGDGFYIAPPSVNWNSLAEYYNDSSNWEDIYAGWDDNEANLTVSSYSKFYDEGETLSFIVSATGNYVVSGDNTNLAIIHNLRFDYNITSYVLQGYNMLTIITGTYDGYDTTFSMNAQISEENYTRGLGFNGLILAVASITSIGLITIIRKRRK